MQEKELWKQALAVASVAWAPYSRFRVGAALLCKDGSIILGVNVENRYFGLTICAERSAISAAISQGKREFSAIAIASPDAQGPLSPCGACRQVLSEFLPPDTPIIFGKDMDSLIKVPLKELVPYDSLHELKEK